MAGSVEIKRDTLKKMFENIKAEICECTNGELLIDEMIKKIDNKDLCFVEKKNEIDLLSPSITSSFFINFINLFHIDKRGQKTKIIFKSMSILDGVVEVVTLGGNKITYKEKELCVSLKPEIPLNVLMTVIN